MTIIWCGGEDIDFPNGSPITVDTSNTSRRRASYSRCSIEVTVLGSMAKSTVFAGGEITSGWLQAQMYWHVIASNVKTIGLIKSGTSSGLFLGSSTPSGRLALYKYNGTTWTKLAEEPGASLVSVVTQTTMQLVNYGVSGTVNVYYNGALVLSYTGDLTIPGVTGFDQIGIYGQSAAAVTSEIIVSDSDPRTFSLVTLAPNAAGDTNGWTGSHSDINETTINDANAVYTNSGNIDFQFNASNIPSGVFTVKAVKMASRCAASNDSALSSMSFGIKSNGTVYSGSSKTIGVNNWQTYETMLSVNPATSIPFTQADVDSLQLNIRSS